MSVRALVTTHDREVLRSNRTNGRLITEAPYGRGPAQSRPRRVAHAVRRGPTALRRGDGGRGGPAVLRGHRLRGRARLRPPGRRPRAARADLPPARRPPEGVGRAPAGAPRGALRRLRPDGRDALRLPL